eukprot:gene26075-biopygen17931
MTRGGCSRP